LIMASEVLENIRVSRCVIFGFLGGTVPLTDKRAVSSTRGVIWSPFVMYGSTAVGVVEAAGERVGGFI
jgi:hypothetical protein